MLAHHTLVSMSQAAAKCESRSMGLLRLPVIRINAEGQLALQVLIPNRE